MSTTSFSTDYESMSVTGTELFGYSSSYGLKRMYPTSGGSSSGVPSQSGGGGGAAHHGPEASHRQHTSQQVVYPFLLTGFRALASPAQPVTRNHRERSQPATPRPTSKTSHHHGPSHDTESMFSMPAFPTAAPRPKTARLAASEFGHSVSVNKPDPVFQDDKSVWDRDYEREMERIAGKHITSVQMLSSQNRRSLRHDSVKGLLGTLTTTPIYRTDPDGISQPGSSMQSRIQSGRPNGLAAPAPNAQNGLQNGALHIDLQPEGTTSRPRSTVTTSKTGRLVDATNLKNRPRTSGFRPGVIKSKTNYGLNGDKMVSNAILRYTTVSQDSPRGAVVSDLTVCGSQKPISKSKS